VALLLCACHSATPNVGLAISAQQKPLNISCAAPQENSPNSVDGIGVTFTAQCIELVEGISRSERVPVIRLALVNTSDTRAFHVDSAFREGLNFQLLLRMGSVLHYSQCKYSYRRVPGVRLLLPGERMSVDVPFVRRCYKPNLPSGTTVEVTATYGALQGPLGFTPTTNALVLQMLPGTPLEE